MKFLLAAILLQFSAVTFGQKIIKMPLPRPNNDTVYIGITNKIYLNDEGGKVVSVNADRARVKFKNDTLIVFPSTPGKLNIYVRYEDRVVTKTVIADYLPDPGKEY